MPKSHQIVAKQLKALPIYASDVTELQELQLASPVRNRQPRSLYTFVVAPGVGEEATKTGELDHALVLDLPRDALLSRILERHLSVKFGRGWRAREMAAESRGMTAIVCMMDLVRARRHVGCPHMFSFPGSPHARR